MHNVKETQKTVKKTDNRVFDTYIIAILVDFAFEFRNKPLTFHREWYKQIYFRKNLICV